MYPAPLNTYIIGVDSNSVWGEGMNEHASDESEGKLPYTARR